MTVLVTGATGKLGCEIIECLGLNGFNILTYSHSMQLSELNWSDITVIVNCAAVTPSNDITKGQYLDGNVVFLQNLLEYSIDKTFIHFSTFSELYKNDFYQLSKMMANSLLLINSHILKNLIILPLPTLEDESLIEKIVSSASAGLMPKVDRLKYNYMSFKSVAYHVKNIITENNNIQITNLYEKRDLYDEVIRRVEARFIIEGKVIDRTLINNGIYHVMPDLLESLSK